MCRARELTVGVRLVALSVVVALSAACGSTTAAPPAAGSMTPVAGTSSGLGEQRSEAAAVTVGASWLSTGVPAVRIVMDTHSVDLDGFDLGTLARVRLDSGPWVPPSSWDVPNGGHHREGTLTFDALDRASFDAARIIELEVRDVALPSRILRWERPR